MLLPTKEDTVESRFCSSQHRQQNRGIREFGHHKRQTTNIARCEELNHCLQHTKTQDNTTMKSAILSSILLSSAYGWTTPRRSPLQQRSLVSVVSTILKAKTETTNDPCWQELSDDDCAMENVYASHFVASEWIKSMPCASGLEVSGVKLIFLSTLCTSILTKPSSCPILSILYGCRIAICQNI